LDLFVSAYIHYDMSHPPIPSSDAAGQAFCEYRGKNVMCGPRGLEDIQWEKYLSAKTALKKTLR
jgi:hypothetical protein